jgi:uncharacterized protein
MPCGWKITAKVHYLSVGLLDDLIPMFAGVPPMMCGMLGHCAPQYVIEADGSVYPCDFYVLDTYRCGNVHTHTFNDILRSEPMQRFLKEPKRMSPLCSDCPFSAMCHGNCKRLNITYFDEQRCGYREFLTQAAPTMRQIAAQLQKNPPKGGFLFSLFPDRTVHCRGWCRSRLAPSAVRVSLVRQYCRCA